MFQVKISAAIVVAVAGILVFGYFSLTGEVTSTVIEAESTRLDTAQRAVADARRSAEASLLLVGQEMVGDPTVQTEMTRLHSIAAADANVERLESNRQKLFARLTEFESDISARMQGYGRLDPSTAGAGLHRELDRRGPRDWWGAPPDMVAAFLAIPRNDGTLAHFSVVWAEEGQELFKISDYASKISLLDASAESGEVTAGVIPWSIHQYFAVSVPLFVGAHDDPQLLGSVLVGYQLDTALTDRLVSVGAGDAQLTVYSQSRFYGGTGLDKEQLANVTYHPITREFDVDDDTSTEFADLDGETNYLTTLGGATLLVQRTRFAPGSDAAFVVTTDISARLATVESVASQLVLVGVALLVVGLGLALLVIRRYLKPLEDIDVGIQEMLAGNDEYMFRARAGNPLHGELCNSLNQLTAHLQGRAGPGEPETEWGELMVDLEPERPSVYGLQAVKQVQDVKVQERLRPLYDEYMRLRQEHEQHVDMDFDRFCRRISRNEASLKEKHGATAVEFSVAVTDGKVVLKPTLTLPDT